MWLDAANKNSYNDQDDYDFDFGYEKVETEEGNILIAINGWQSYYDVRINQLDLRAGTDVVIKIEPVVHSTSPDFRKLKIYERQCRFSDENEVYWSFYATILVLVPALV